MIDIVSLRNNVIDLATSGQISSDFICYDSVDDIITELPPASKKRKTLLGKTYEYAQKYEIPEHWRWVKLGEISSYGDTPKKAMPADVDKNTWILELEDIEAGGRLLKKERVLTSKSKGEKTIFKQGQVLYSKLRPYLKKILVADEDGISTPELISFDVYGGIQAQYIVLCLLNSYTNSVIDKRSYGIKMPRVDAGFMANLPIPLPPVSEQEFIVDKMNQVFSTINDIDDFQLRYSLNVEILKTKIMDAAFQGKLTEQLPTDGRAEELYIKIQCNKEILIKDGKIKKAKKLFPVKDEEVPYRIPANWKWVRIGDVLNEVIVPQRDKPPFSGDIPWCRIEDKDGVFLNGTKSGQYVSKDTVEKMNLRIFPIGTVLSACSGASIGTILITTVECCTNQTFNGLVCNTYFYNWFLFWYLKSVIPKLKNMGTGSAMAYISQDKIRNMLMPLPPYAEQLRIVEKLENTIKIVSNLQ